MESTLAFISHRSTHKDFVRKIVETVKRDNCIVDEFDFYPATKTMDEIVRNLNHAPIFVLLISKMLLILIGLSLKCQNLGNFMKRVKSKHLCPLLLKMK